MKIIMNQKNIKSALILMVILCALLCVETFGQDNIAKTDLLGVWQQYADIPWAIQFNEDGTFRAAYTVARLEQVPEDEGRFLLRGTSLSLVSDKDCKGSCKGLKGIYKVEFTAYGWLLLKEQKEACEVRSIACTQPWVRVAP